ncbi:RagB/SusD family nutrient uptake outer membrane protein [Hymenobacter lapidiphilus]|uniref:RagB/SusD family nutrient uptake outer membrane protein n=1 Tax=Hymenobacter sp. CCM 8763 TaxID=2303334 RepID=UPI000E3563A1|nr:RagB/SusD family nutrient uptake outer membrane protein [Hymenobacter sp. CCM 8763]RFP65516.1 RagB/SusD family nutrient uptake outer membrane protein [Hymenobacter sp. CCM 8763]
MKTISVSFRRLVAPTALLLTLGLLGCDKQLDIEPQQSVDAATALSTPEGVQSALTGVYARLDLPQSYGTNLLLMADLLAADLPTAATFTYIGWQGTFQSYREVSRKQMTDVNTEADRTWNQNFQTINLVNLVLDALPVVADADDKQRIEGEARMIRGMLYFELARLYAQPYRTTGAFSNAALGVPAPTATPGLPINLSANKTEADAARRIARSSLEETYTQILADLTAAQDLLPEANDRTRFDQYDAKAFLARVYLQRGEYATARDLANEVINDSGASLNASSVSTFTNKNSSEVLFEIQQNDQNNAGNSNDGLATFYSSNAAGFGGRGDVRIYQSFVDLYGADDQRGFNPQIGASLIYEGTGRRAGFLRTYKWNNAGQNIPILRLSEMYLIRAETNLRLGTSVGATALVDVNRIRTRARATPLANVTLASVLQERDLEFAFEGFRVHDYKRSGRSIGAGTAAIPANAPALVMPIPKYEINLGNALPQNEGY